MYISVSSGLDYKKPVFEILPKIAEAGFNSVELLVTAGHWHTDRTDEITRMKSLLDDLNLSLSSVHAPFYNLDPSSFLESEREKSVEAILSAARAAKQLGAPIVVAHFGGEPNNGATENERSRQAARSIRQVLDRLPEGVTLAAETLLPHLAVGHPLNFLLLLKMFERSPLRVCFDTSHAVFTGKTSEYLRLISDKLVSVHVSDNNGKYDDHAIPMSGVVPWGEVMSVLKDREFPGPLVLELMGPSRGESMESYLKKARQAGEDLLSGRPEIDWT